MKRLALNYLVKWKNQKEKMPLIILGQRHVGKTCLFQEFFIKYNYKKYIFIDFSTNSQAKELFELTIKPTRLLPLLENLFKTRIESNTFLFFDEIQFSSKAITSLKYFNQDTPDIPIICAGCLLEISTQYNKTFFPVGKVEFLDLYPLNFEEFLLNCDASFLSIIEEAYKTMTPLSANLHQLALDYFFTYLTIGGLPKALSTYFNTKSIPQTQDTISTIYKDCTSMMSQFTNKSQFKIIKGIYDQVYDQLNKKNKNFKYSKVAKGKFKEEFIYPLKWLKESYLVNTSAYLSNSTSTLTYGNDSIFRVYYSDMGLFTYLRDQQPNALTDKQQKKILNEITFENYVSTELARCKINQFFWKGKSKAELEFLIRHNNDNTIPIDVKASNSFNSIRIRISKQK